ncbi:hypothetical protein [Gemmatimonas sp.]|nr:hypothetical protein [Gemmatimonas sp.]
MIPSSTDRFDTRAAGPNATGVYRLTITDVVSISDGDAAVLVPLEG